jgi:hypothetical protein
VTATYLNKFCCFASYQAFLTNGNAKKDPSVEAGGYLVIQKAFAAQ